VTLELGDDHVRGRLALYTDRLVGGRNLFASVLFWSHVPRVAEMSSAKPTTSRVRCLEREAVDPQVELVVG
jgi:hypothetical protein